MATAPTHSFTEKICSEIKAIRGENWKKRIVVIVPGTSAHLHHRRALAHLDPSAGLNVRFKTFRNFIIDLTTGQLIKGGLKPLSPLAQLGLVAKVYRRVRDESNDGWPETPSPVFLSELVKAIRRIREGESAPRSGLEASMVNLCIEAYLAELQASGYADYSAILNIATAELQADQNGEPLEGVLLTHPVEWLTSSEQATWKQLAAAGGHQIVPELATSELLKTSVILNEYVEGRQIAEWICQQIQSGIPANELAVVSDRPSEVLFNVAPWLKANQVEFNGPSPYLVKDAPGIRLLNGLLALKGSQFPFSETLDWLTDLNVDGFDESNRAKFSNLGIVRFKTGLELAQFKGAVSQISPKIEASIIAAEHLAVAKSWMMVKEAVETLAEALGVRLDSAPVPWLELAAIHPEFSEALLQTVVNEVGNMDDRSTSGYGKGVFFGRLQDVYGLNFQAIWVAGLTETAYSPHSASNFFLHDLDEVGGNTTTRKQILEDSWEALWQAGSDLYLSTIKVDSADGNPLMPHPWLLRSASDTGVPLSTKELYAGANNAKISRIASYNQSLEGGIALNGDEGAIGNLGLEETIQHRQEAVQLSGNGKYNSRTGRTGFGLDPSGTVWSPSAIEEYSKCPRQFFFKRVLKLSPLDEDADDEADALQLGRVLHLALQTLGEQGAFRTALTWDGIEDAISKAATEVLGQVAKNSFTELKLAALSRQIAELSDQLALVDDRTIECEVEIPETELTFGSTQAKFTGRIDRLELSEGRPVRIVDYKLGSVPSPVPKNNLSNGKTLQIALYARLAAEKFNVEAANPPAGSYLFLKDGKAAEVPTTPNAASEGVTAWPVDAFIERYFELMKEGEFPTRTTSGLNGTCQYCDYKLICTPLREDVEKDAVGALELSMLWEGKEQS